MDIAKAERLLDKVHLALSRQEPDWMEKALKSDEIPKGAAEAVEAVLRANGLSDMDDQARHELAEHWTELGCADFAKLVVSEDEVMKRMEKPNA